jgi:hypothetical protein
MAEAAKLMRQPQRRVERILDTVRHVRRGDDRDETMSPCVLGEGLDEGAGHME